MLFLYLKKYSMYAFSILVIYNPIECKIEITIHYVTVNPIHPIGPV